MEIMRAVNLFIKGKDLNTFMAVRRSDRDKIFAGMLALPGGEIEPGESALDAGPREFREETGAELQSMEPQPSIVTQVDLGQFVLSVVVHKATLDFNQSFKPDDSDIAEVLWVKPVAFLTSLRQHAYPETEIQRLESFLVTENFEIK